MMNNNKGTILVLTMTFMLIFTLLGVGGMYYAGVQNEDAVKRQSSMEAFWLADGGIQYAKKKAPGSFSKTTNPIVLENNGTYWVESTVQKNDYWGNPARLLIDSQGAVNIYNAQGTLSPQRRRINAIISKTYIDKSLTTRGPIKKYDPTLNTSTYCDKPDPAVTWVCDDVQASRTDLSLMEVFNMNLEDFYGVEHDYYEDPKSKNLDIDLNSLDRPVIVKMVNDNTIQLPSDQLSTINPAFVLIDTTECTYDNRCLTGNNASPIVNIEGGDFYGILYIIGEAKFGGNPIFHGAVFVESDPTDITPVDGHEAFYFDPLAVANALNDVGSVKIGQFRIVSWEEKAPLVE